MPMPSEKGTGEDMAMKRAGAFSMATRANGEKKLATFHGRCLGMFVSWPPPEITHNPSSYVFHKTEISRTQLAPLRGPSSHGDVRPSYETYRV